MPSPESNRRRYKKTLSLAEALDLSPMLKRLGVRDGDKQMAVYQKWDSVVGETVARHTHPVKFNKGILTVSVRSAGWLHELTLMKPQIMENLDKEFGKGFIQDMRLRNAEFDLGKLKESDASR